MHDDPRRSETPSGVVENPLTSTSTRATTVDARDLPNVPPSRYAVGANLGSTEPFDLTASTSTSTSTFGSRSMSGSREHSTPHLDPLAFDSFQLVPLNYPVPNFVVGPELAQHLFYCFAQTPQHEHPLLASYSLTRTMRLVSWDVSLLPPHTQILASCVFAVGALVSPHRDVLDPYRVGLDPTCPNPAASNDPHEAVNPDSFESVLRDLPDLRKYGKMRQGLFQRLKDDAIRKARESDVLFVASPETATACYLLDFLESTGHSQASHSLWITASRSHIRVLAANPLLGDGDLAIRWAIYLLVESIHAILTNGVPP
ncbi:hypothetical protein JCM10212_003808 [Sporobolomyces blumeae]